MESPFSGSRDQRAPALHRGVAAATTATNWAPTPQLTGMGSSPTRTAETSLIPTAAATPTTTSMAAAAPPPANTGSIDADVSSATRTGPDDARWCATALRADARAVDAGGLSGISAPAVAVTLTLVPSAVSRANSTLESPLTSTGSKSTCTGSRSLAESCPMARLTPVPAANLSAPAAGTTATDTGPFTCGSTARCEFGCITCSSPACTTSDADCKAPLIDTVSAWFGITTEGLRGPST